MLSYDRLLDKNSRKIVTADSVPMDVLRTVAGRGATSRERLVETFVSREKLHDPSWCFACFGGTDANDSSMDL